MTAITGCLIAFEGLDQSGKQTQADRLAAACRASGHRVETLSFPDYETSIGAEIGAALRGQRDYAADTMQLLYIANRYEYRPRIEQWLLAGAIVICDRYLASSIAYGEAQGLDLAWLVDTQRHLPQPSLTMVLDIPPDASLRRKQVDRDKFERDLALLARVRASYQQQARQPGWLLIDGQQDKEVVSEAVLAATRARLGLP